MNRLKSATSPYLLQHADNPVDWWPWSEEAFAEARRRDVPVLLSVGYAACHWCHVMAHESFEDPSVAAVVNDSVVAIKVDREERPDIDAVYMSATQAMTGQGGWPMTVFMTPERRAVLLRHVLPAGPVHPAGDLGGGGLAEEQGEDQERVGTDLGCTRRERFGAVRAGRRGGRAQPGRGDRRRGGRASQWVRRGARRLRPGTEVPALDGPGVPAPAPRARRRRGRRWRWPRRPARRWPVAACTTSSAAVSPGTAWTRRWTVPHFEKMLYDNALLIGVYTHLWRLTGSALARRVAEETCDFMVRELRTPEGGLSASLDADSDGAEGVYYVWTPSRAQRGSRRRATARSRPGCSASRSGHLRARHLGPAAPDRPRRRPPSRPPAF